MRFLRFADHIDLMGGTSYELQDHTNICYERVGAYGKVFSTEKSKVVVNNTTNTN
ncbi:hypothetical protein DPMN_066077 [Dreissena polymorpha]|uniref:Uncharacterized protein n=1 Tax=Dreissena polymorpha TaxID=45954 RepID=A0A9D3YVP1_DREPO|nr:hypothetical protein DPMN_066077 [Dreissena polymorpha]